MASAQAQVAVIGGGVVGCAVAHALARRGVRAVLLEAEPGLALGASGANSGILHTGFDSPPGELESVQDAAARLPRGRIVSPRTDPEQRLRERARWQAFVEAAARL